MSPRFLVRLTSFCVLFTLLFVGIVSAWGMFEIANFQHALHPPMQYEASIRLPEPPPPPVDRSREGPEFGTLQPGSGKASTQFTGSWSRFRGDRFDAIASDSPSLARPQSNGPDPKLLWQLQLGPGYAGAAIREGKVFILDYDTPRRRDALRCLSLDNGEEIWNYSYPVKIPENHGVSRTIPALTDEFCLTLGPLCHVACFEQKTGKLLWSRNLTQEYGTVVPQWYAGQCPLISQPQGKDWAILAPCGPEVLMVAIDCQSGEEIWKTPNPFGWTMTHTSIFPMKLDDGRDSFVYVGKEGIVGVDAHNGEILWANFEWKIGMATCPSPLVLPENRVFLCGGYAEPCAMLQISQSQDAAQTPYQAKLLWKKKASIFGSEQQTPLFFENHIFGIRQRDRKFTCLTLDGKARWHSGSKADLGSTGAAPYMIADGMFLLLSDEGKLTFAEATAEEFRPIAAFEIIPNGAEAWGPMGFADGLLLLRDITRMYCLDLRAL